MEVPLGSRHLINPGAVGQPRDGDWRAAFAIYDETLAKVTFFRAPYDVAGRKVRFATRTCRSGWRSG